MTVLHIHQSICFAQEDRDMGMQHTLRHERNG